MPLRQERKLLPAAVLGASVRSASQPAGHVCVCVRAHACVYVILRKHLVARACRLPGRSYLLCHSPSLTQCPSWYQSRKEPQVSWPLRGAEASLRGAGGAQLTAESTVQCPPGPTPAALTVRGVPRDLHGVGMRGFQS